jgi:hypothetical protein
MPAPQQRGDDEPKRSRTATRRATARGLVAAMAVTGLRTVTQNAGLLEESPPDAILERWAPRLVKRLSVQHRAVVRELLHWSYGAVGGGVFGVLPTKVRSHPLSGPVYGTVIWLGFELGVAPLLDLRNVRQNHIVGRAMIALDHALYGLVVAGRLAPEPEVAARVAGRRPA